MTAVGGMATFLGIGVIYLPFVADRDKMRGLHEEDSPPTSAMLAQEIKKLQKEGALRQEDDDETTNIPGSKRIAPGSMWSKFSK